jgi:hypothetical protein
MFLQHPFLNQNPSKNKYLLIMAYIEKRMVKNVIIIGDFYPLTCL